MLNRLSMLIIATLLTACAIGSQAPEQTPSPETAAELPTTKTVTTTATAVDVLTQTATDAPIQTATDTQIPVLTPTAVPLTSTESFCENLGAHMYCLSAELPKPPATPVTWGAISGYSPEVFCASDLSIELCGWITSALLAAAMEWGNYGPVEYWVLGIDVAAAEKLTEVNCQRREDRDQWNMSDCLRKHSPSGDHGFESYRKIGADAVAAGRPSGSAGLNGDRGWGIHYFTSSLPVGFTDYFEVSGADEQNTVFHEYFHAVQHAHIYTEDRDKRDELLGPVWFNEGGATYMALVGSRNARTSGALQQVKMEGRWPFVFEDNMEWKMTDALEKRRSVCPGLPMKDLTYENSCDNASYDLGAWAHAYLASKFGYNVLLDTFYLNLEELGWEETFVKTYGMTSEAFYAEFDTFLDLPLSEQLAMLPSSKPDHVQQALDLDLELELGVGGLVSDLEAWAEQEIAQFYTSSHIDISTLQFVSKYRSRAGHDYSGSFGACSSNKHYFHPFNMYEVALSTPIYSASDGVFLYVQTETGYYADDWKNNYAEKTGKQWPENLQEYQLFFRPDAAPNLWIRYHHVTPIDEMFDDVVVVEGNDMMMQRERPKLPGFRVQAGDLIAHGLGEISIEQHLDGPGIPSPCTSAHVRTTRGNLPGCLSTTRFLSIFDYMTDEVFAQYQSISDVEREDFIITEKELTKNPYTCTGEFFDDKGGTPNADTYVLLQGTRGGSPSNLIDDISSAGDVGELVASFDGFGNGNYGPFDTRTGDVMVITSDGGPLAVRITDNGASRKVYSRPEGSGIGDYETLVPMTSQIGVQVTAPETVNWQVVIVRTK